MQNHDLPIYFIHFSYLGIFLWFLFLQEVSPVPEEISLITIGYISTFTNLNIFLAGLIALTGSLLQDHILYYLSQQQHILIINLINRIKKEFFEKFRNRIVNNKGKTIFILKFIPKLRLLSPVLSGLTGVSLKYFFILNLFASLVYSGLYISLGFFFFFRFSRLEKVIPSLNHFLFLSLMVLLGLIIMFNIVKKFYR